MEAAKQKHMAAAHSSSNYQVSCLEYDQKVRFRLHRKNRNDFNPLRTLRKLGTEAYVNSTPESDFRSRPI
jgi:hypothetical protein